MSSILLTNSALVIGVQMRGEGGRCGVSANEDSCAHQVTWTPNKLWRSTSIFNLLLSYNSNIQRGISGFFLLSEKGVVDKTWNEDDSAAFKLRGNPSIWLAGL
jgi:hypothetical protein